eukprot:m51a1_g1466 hypothetical protein (303) ;mRNA; r:233924-235635
MATSVTVAVGTAWMCEHGVTNSDVRRAADEAAVYRCADVSQSLGPCFKCCDSSKRPKKPLVIAGSVPRQTPPVFDAATPGLALFRFDNCRSHCSSSRHASHLFCPGGVPLHFGGRLFFEMRVGGVTVKSPDLELCSKIVRRSALRTHGAATSPEPSQQRPGSPRSPGATPEGHERRSLPLQDAEGRGDAAARPDVAGVLEGMQVCRPVARWQLPDTSMCVRVCYTALPLQYIGNCAGTICQTSSELPGFLGYFWNSSPSGIILSISWFDTADRTRAHNESVLGLYSQYLASGVTKLLAICYR